MACLGKGFKTGPYLEKTRRYCQWQGSCAKTLTFHSTPTVTEGICFKLKRSCKSSKGEYLQHWQVICKVFFYKVIPLFQLIFKKRKKIKHLEPSVGPCILLLAQGFSHRINENQDCVVKGKYFKLYMLERDRERFCRMRC